MDKKGYKYDIAFSVAGQQKTFAQEIKDELTSQGVNCWIYTEKEAEQITDLPPFYEKLFTEQCAHAVPIISEEYVSKPYTNLERQYIIARSMQDGKYVIPIQFQEGVKLKGLASTYGYISRKGRSPKEIAEVILRFIKQDEYQKIKPAIKNDFYIPKRARSINPITERKAWIKYLVYELKQRSQKVEGLEMDDDDEGSHHKLLFQYNGEVLLSIRIIKGGIGNDNGLSFGFDHGYSSGSGINAWGDFKLDTEKDEVLLNTNGMGFNMEDGMYTKKELVNALWKKVTDQIDEENKK